MEMFKTFLFVAATVYFVHMKSISAVSYYPALTLYIGQNFTDRSLTFSRSSYNNYFHNLTYYNFNDKSRSMKYNGIWIFYEHVNYNEGNEGEVIWRNGFDQEELLDRCDMGGKLSSVRQIGNANNFSTPSLNFYQHENFTGLNTLRLEANTNDLWFNFTSLIVIGNGSWTFFENTDYTGKSYCLNTTADVSFMPNVHTISLPFPNHIGSINVTESSSTDIDLHSRPKLYFSFRSVEKGCWGCDGKGKKTTT